MLLYQYQEHSPHRCSACCQPQIDESSHAGDFNIFSVNLVTDTSAIALGWLLYATDEAWAEDARDLLTELAPYLPERAHIIVLGDRIHTGEQFLERLDVLGWDYIFRAPATRWSRRVAAGRSSRPWRSRRTRGAS